MSEDATPVRYEERDTLAIITLSRPDKLNTLTEAVVQGVADGPLQMIPALLPSGKEALEPIAIALEGRTRLHTSEYSNRSYYNYCH